jgi:hypothetical protein
LRWEIVRDFVTEIVEGGRWPRMNAPLAQMKAPAAPMKVERLKLKDRKGAEEVNGRTR